MMPSRGMGDIRSELKSPRKVMRKDADVPTELYAKGGEVWNKPRPKGLGASKPLSAAKKASAKAAAKAAGRPYPNLIDNMRAAK
jgi:hypothetical protein